MPHPHRGHDVRDVPLNLELKLEVWDSPNSAGVITDAIRCLKLGLDRGLAGTLVAPSAYFMKSPPLQIHDDIARERVEAFIRGDDSDTLTGSRRVGGRGDHAEATRPQSRGAAARRGLTPRTRVGRRLCAASPPDPADGCGPSSRGPGSASSCSLFRGASARREPRAAAGLGAGRPSALRPRLPPLAPEARDHPSQRLARARPARERSAGRRPGARDLRLVFALRARAHPPARPPGRRARPAHAPRGSGPRGLPRPLGTLPRGGPRRHRGQRPHRQHRDLRGCVRGDRHPDVRARGRFGVPGAVRDRSTGHVRAGVSPSSRGVDSGTSSESCARPWCSAWSSTGATAPRTCPCASWARGRRCRPARRRSPRGPARSSCPVAARRERDGRYHPEMSTPIEVPDGSPGTLAAATQAIADALEAMVRAAPEQWHTFKPMWPATAEESAALEARARGLTEPA